MDIYERSKFKRIQANANDIAQRLEHLSGFCYETATKYEKDRDTNAYFIYTGNSIAYDIARNIVMELVRDIEDMAKIINVEEKNNG